MPPVDPASNGVRLTLHVQPGASRSELAGRHGTALKVRVAAPPVDGAANRELLRFLAKALGVPPSAMAMISGATGRRKRVVVTGVTVAAAAEKLGLSAPLP